MAVVQTAAIFLGVFVTSRRDFLSVALGTTLPLLLPSTVFARPKKILTSSPNRTLITKNIPYTNLPVPLTCTMYRPSQGGPFPVIFLIFDGGWQFNDIAQADVIGDKLAKEGFASIAPKLRTAPTYQAPSPMEDCARLLDFCVLHASQYNLSSNKFAAMGGSGGGHVSSFMSLDKYLTEDQFNRVRCTVLGSSPTQLREMDNDGAQGNFTLAIEEFLGVAEEDSPETWDLFSPALQVTSFTKPMWLGYSVGDPIPPSQGQRLATALQNNSVENEFHVYSGSLHGWQLILDISPWSSIVSWFHSHLD